MKIKGKHRTISAIPAVDFDPTKCLIDEYCSKLGKYAIFFYNKYQADRIFVLYRKNFRSPSRKELSDCAEHFGCAEDMLKLQNAFKKSLLEFGSCLVKTVGGSFDSNFDEVVEKPKKRKHQETALEHVQPVIEIDVPKEKKQRKIKKKK